MAKSVGKTIKFTVWWSAVRKWGTWGNWIENKIKSKLIISPYNTIYRISPSTLSCLASVSCRSSRYPISASTAQQNCDLHGLEVSPSHCRTCLAVHPAYLGPGGIAAWSGNLRDENYIAYARNGKKLQWFEWLQPPSICDSIRPSRSISIKKCPHLPTSLRFVSFVNKEVLMSLLSSFSSGNGLFIKACFLQNVQLQLVWHFWNV